MLTKPALVKFAIFLLAVWFILSGLIGLGVISIGTAVMAVLAIFVGVFLIAAWW